LILDAIFISQPAASPPGDPYDSAVDLTQVASNVVISSGKPVEVAVAYTVHPDRPILIAFDVNADNAFAYIRVAPAEQIVVNGIPQPEGILYQQIGLHEAAIADRLPSATNPTGTPYSAVNVVAIVEKIVVGYA
jgi:hypothetical protein